MWDLLYLVASFGKVNCCLATASCKVCSHYAGAGEVSILENHIEELLRIAGSELGICHSLYVK